MGFVQRGLSEHMACKSECVAWQCLEKQKHYMFTWFAQHGLAEHRVCESPLVLTMLGEAESHHFDIICAAWIGCEVCLLVA